MPSRNLGRDCDHHHHDQLAGPELDGLLRAGAAGAWGARAARPPARASGPGSARRPLAGGAATLAASARGTRWPRGGAGRGAVGRGGTHARHEGVALVAVLDGGGGPRGERQRERECRGERRHGRTHFGAPCDFDSTQVLLSLVTRDKEDYRETLPQSVRQGSIRRTGPFRHRRIARTLATGERDLELQIDLRRFSHSPRQPFPPPQRGPQWPPSEREKQCVEGSRGRGTEPRDGRLPDAQPPSRRGAHPSKQTRRGFRSNFLRSN